VEAALLEHPAVLEAAVVGRPDEAGLMRPAAHCVLKEGAAPGPLLEGEMREVLRQRLPGYKVPRWITFVPDLPKTATGKIQRFRLRAGP
jgi:acyl-coenzyme A synthetase/AMP-(fatty) acid ligase